MPATLCSPIPLFLNATLAAPACRYLCVQENIPPYSFSAVYWHPDQLYVGQHSAGDLCWKRQELNISRSIDIFLNQVQMCTATPNVVLEKAALFSPSTSQKQHKKGKAVEEGLFFRRSMLNNSINYYWVLSSGEKIHKQVNKQKDDTPLSPAGIYGSARLISTDNPLTGKLAGSLLWNKRSP